MKEGNQLGTDRRTFDDLRENTLRNNTMAFKDLGEGCSSPHKSLKDKESLFKTVVKKHFVKAKLFNLVSDLLQSIDDEKQAQKDLITAFQTVREVTGPIRKQSTAASKKIKRRRKISEVSLLDKITQNRRESILKLEDVDIYNKDLPRIGELKISARDADVNEHHTDSNELVEGTLTSNYDLNECDEHLETEIVNQGSPDNSSEKDLPRRTKRSISLPANENEKILATHQLNRNENTSEIDHLVLDSVLRSNDSVNIESNPREHNLEEKYLNEPQEAQVNNKHSGIQVQVESDTESEEEENQLKVVGSNDDMDNDEYGDSSHSDDDAVEFKKLNDPNYFVSTMEYNVVPACIEPRLDPIAEASHESFQSLGMSSHESCSVIEIQSKEPKGGWIEDYKIDTVASNNKSIVSYHNGDVLDKFKDSKKKSDISNKRTKINYHEEKAHKERNKSNGKISQNTGNSSFQSTSSSDEPDNYNIGSAKSHKSNSAQSSRQHNGHVPNKGKEKQQKEKKLITIDILGLYESNTDLQKISKSEISSSRKETSVQTPKKQRSKSPKRKREREWRKYDMKPLPPKTLSGKYSHYIPNYALKTELSSTSRSSNASSADDINESFRSFQSLQDDRRYKQPDSVLWERLDLSEGKSKPINSFAKHNGAYGSLNYNQDGGIYEEDVQGYSRSFPLQEAIRNIKSAKCVPRLRELSATLPREERVGRLYIDLKQERRTASRQEYRRLKDRRQEDDFYESTYL